MKRTIIVMLSIMLLAGTLAAAESLNPIHTEDLLYMLEEEKLARDLYAELGDYWNLRVFNNITRSEETHRSRVQELADDYDLDYRVMPAGSFSLPEIQTLYDHLLAEGMKGVREALEVGRSVEVLDIEDLDAALSRNPPEDIRIVLESLRRGSENHLRAFEKQLDR